LAIHQGVLSRYVEQDYVAESYVEGKPIAVATTLQTTPEVILGSGVVVSSTTVTTTVTRKVVNLGLQAYTWDECGSGKFDWDNWPIGNTWEKQGLIIRANSSLTPVGGTKKVGEIDVFSLSDVTTTGRQRLQGNSAIDVLSTKEISPGVIRDGVGTITGEASIVTLGGFNLSAQATLDVTSVTQIQGATLLTGVAQITNAVDVGVDGSVTYFGNLSIPVSTVVETTGILKVEGSATINLGTVIVTIGSSTPLADPFRTRAVLSETRTINALKETRTGIVQSESRVIIVPKETRTFTVSSETRTVKVPVPPFVSGSITERENV
jgi:hypothetical protein